MEKIYLLYGIHEILDLNELKLIKEDDKSRIYSHSNELIKIYRHKVNFQDKFRLYDIIMRILNLDTKCFIAPSSFIFDEKPKFVGYTMSYNPKEVKPNLDRDIEIGQIIEYLKALKKDIIKLSDLDIDISNIKKDNIRYDHGFKILDCDLLEFKKNNGYLLENNILAINKQLIDSIFVDGLNEDSTEISKDKLPLPFIEAYDKPIFLDEVLDNCQKNTTVNVLRKNWY